MILGSHQEPLINLHVEPEGEEYVFLIDTGATRTSICIIPKGIEQDGENMRIKGVKGVKGEPFEVPLVKMCV